MPATGQRVHGFLKSLLSANVYACVGIHPEAIYNKWRDLYDWLNNGGYFSV